MKIMLGIVSVMLCMLLVGCSNAESIAIIGGADGPTAMRVDKTGENVMYEQITSQEAKAIMDTGEDFVVLDVREQEEYDAGHIHRAILIPYTDIEQKAEAVLADKNQTVLVYCRSGRRSKIAAESLAKLGYVKVKEFGGILDWPYEIEK